MDKIKVEIYPNGELGGEREMLEMLLLGDLTMMAPSSAPLEAVSKGYLPMGSSLFI